VHADDAVGVDLEGDLDLDLARGRPAQAGEDELAEQLVLLGAVALALQHQDLHRGLVVLDVVKTWTSRWAPWCSARDELVEVARPRP
jgi:hypothetical protein